MSIFEILVVMIVALLVVKPEDMPKIISKLKELREFVTKTKKEIFSHFDPDINTKSLKNKSEDLSSQMEQMNYFLEKIGDLDSEYSGEYSLSSVKEHYRKLMNKKINTELKKK
jgi:Sec-independent protein translocase protein TatA